MEDFTSGQTFGVDPLIPQDPLTINPLTIQLKNNQISFSGSDRIDELYLKFNDNQELTYSNDGVNFFTDLNPLTAQKDVLASFAGINIEINLQGGNDSLYLDTSLITALKQYGSTLTFDGGQGQDTLFGPALKTTWNITGLNTGNVDAVNFNNIENLTGAVNNEDTFVFSNDGGLSGTVDGAAGGFDTLVLDGGNYNSAVYSATSPDSGSISLDSKLITYAGLEPIVDNTVVNDRTFDATANNDQIVLEQDASGKNKISSSNSTFESIVFLNPSNSLTINAGDGQDTITVKSLDPNFRGNLTINGQENGISAGDDGFLDTGLFIADTVTFAEGLNVNLLGKSLTVDAEKIIAENNVVISTKNPTGNSGAVKFTGENIELKTGVQILADATSGFTAGDITITADETQKRLGSEPYGVNIKNISVTIGDGSILKGGKIAITSTAADISLIDLAPAYLKDVVIKPFAQLLPQAFNAILPASVQYRSASATVTISGAKITGSKDVSITATTKVDSSVQAVSSVNPINPLSRFAVAYGQAETTAKVDIQGVVNSTTGVTNKTEIIGKQGVTITSDATTKDEVSARVFGNEGILGIVPVNGKDFGFAIAVANSNTTSKALIGKDVTITSDEGNIKVKAKGKISNVAKATTNIFVNGTAGIGIGLNFDRSDIVAEVNGTLTAAGKKEINQEIDLTKVNNTDDTITLLGHGLKTDDQIQYFTNGGIAIDGLTDQEKYYVLVKDQDKIQLAKALGLELDNSGVAANSQQGFSKRDSKEFNIKTDVDFNTNQIKIVNHGFVTGQKVNYNSLLADPLDTLEGNTSGVLTNNNLNYYIIKDSSDRFRLAASTADATAATPIAIDLVQPNGTSTNTNSLSSILFTQAPKQFNPAGDAVKDNIVTLNNHGFLTGDAVVYNVDGTISTTTNLSVNNTFDPATAVNATNNTIAITSHGLNTGDKVTYLTDYVGQPGTGINTLTNGVAGNLTNGVNYYVIKVDNDTVKLATSAANAIAGTAIDLTGGGTGVFHNLRINRQVAAGDTAIGGLQDGDTYYISVIDANHFRLADSEVQARDAAPIDINSTGATATTTKQAFVKPENLSQGIEILADLVANDRVGVTAKTGSNPKIKDIIANGDVASGAFKLFDFADFKNNLKAIPGSDSANTFSIGAGLGLNWVQRSADVDGQASGTTAKVGSTARLFSNKDVTITSQVKQETQMIVDTSTGKDEAGVSVSVSVGVAIYKNFVNATVDSNAENCIAVALGANANFTPKTYTQQQTS